MKITSVECLVLDGDFPFVWVRTDEGGYGDRGVFQAAAGGCEGSGGGAAGACDCREGPAGYRTAVQGYDGGGFGGGDGAGRYSALSRGWISRCGISKGRRLGFLSISCWAGRSRDRVPVYASSMRRDLTPLEEARRAASLVEQGYSGYKLHSAVPGEIDDRADGTIATVTEVRAAVGDDVDILVDVNGAYSVHQAMYIGAALDDLGVFHFEEPRPAQDLEGLAQIADALRIPDGVGGDDLYAS